MTEPKRYCPIKPTYYRFAIPLMIVASFLLMWMLYYEFLGQGEIEAKHHAEKLQLLHKIETMTEDNAVREAQNKKDFMREFKQNRYWHEMYLEAVKQNEQQIIENKQDYVEEIIRINNSPIDSVLQLLSRQLSQTDSL